MAEIINMPRLSDTMEEGVVAKWLKQVGDSVEEGDILAEIETDKATMEFESFHEGTLLHIGVQEGETSPVDTLLAIIGEKGEDISGLLNGAPAAKDAKTEEAPEEETKKEEASSVSIPDGVEVISMPRLSDTMEEGTVASWLKKVGDGIEEGDILAEIETDKATMEFESFYEGTLLHIGVDEGGSAPVDSLLAIVGPKGTDVSGLVAAHKNGTLSSENASEATIEEAPKKEASASPVVENTSTSNGGRIFASPLAKKIAKDKGINLADLKGSGENGRIVKKDVESYTPAATQPVQTTSSTTTTSSPAPVATFAPAGEEGFEDVKNSQMRKVIAKRLGESKFYSTSLLFDYRIGHEQRNGFS